MCTFDVIGRVVVTCLYITTEFLAGQHSFSGHKLMATNTGHSLILTRQTTSKHGNDFNIGFTLIQPRSKGPSLGEKSPEVYVTNCIATAVFLERFQCFLVGL